MRVRGLYTIAPCGSRLRVFPRPPAEGGYPASVIDPFPYVLDYIKGGASIVQLRDKDRMQSIQAMNHFRNAARKIASLRKDYPFLFIVNDDVSLAKEVDADGVHVGKDDAPIGECRKVLGPEKIIGYSSHAIEEAVAAERQGADYVAFGAIFPTPTKGPGHPVQGLDRLRQVVRSVKIPVVAIGGIGRDNIKDVLATGVASVAMISALAKAKDHVAEAQWFSRFFKE